MHATSAGLKALCTFTTADGLEECRKCCGGHGVLLASGLAQMTIDYVTYCTAEGDRIILELQCARYLIKQQDKNLTKNLSKSSSIQSLDQFKDFDSILEIFEYRSLNQIQLTSNRYSKLCESLNSSDAWNQCSLDLVQCSRFHCYFIILRSFINQTLQIDDLHVKNAMKNLCMFFAFSHIQDHFGDWIGYFSYDHLLWVKEIVRDLILLLRNDLISFTDAFEFPDNVLNSALGKFDGNVYEALYESAKNSPLNKTDPFAGYKHLETVLDKELLQSLRINANL